MKKLKVTFTSRNFHVNEFWKLFCDFEVEFDRLISLKINQTSADKTDILVFPNNIRMKLSILVHCVQKEKTKQFHN